MLVTLFVLKEYVLFVFSLVLLCQEFCSSRTFILISCIRKAVIHIVENLFVVEVMINPQVCFCLSAKNILQNQIKKIHGEYFLFGYERVKNKYQKSSRINFLMNKELCRSSGGCNQLRWIYNLLISGWYILWFLFEGFIFRMRLSFLLFSDPGKPKAGKYGDYQCDIPTITFENMLQHLNATHAQQVT